jgi:hypothetical protein
MCSISSCSSDGVHGLFRKVPAVSARWQVLLLQVSATKSVYTCLPSLLTKHLQNSIIFIMTRDLPVQLKLLACPTCASQHLQLSTQHQRKHNTHRTHNTSPEMPNSQLCCVPEKLQLLRGIQVVTTPMYVVANPLTTPLKLP